ncbi:MAG: pyridoxal phosphate-dependent aminotransferase [Candidatus Omnitrophica bacterium]|nr:pyridoxal phosphate-dependent aminotransferase [Candidatus Omnitrophota bacterium]
MFASRTNWKFSTNPLSSCLQSLQKAGAKILDLTESNPTRCHFRYLNSELLQPLAHPSNVKYDPISKGLPEARKLIQNDYRARHIVLNENQILLTASTSEAYTFLFRLLLNPGESILAPRPSYPLFDFLAGLNDVSIKSYSLRYASSGWHIDIPSLSEAVGPETRAIILVHPNNPTGSFVKKTELSEILDIAKEKSLAIISDEVFFEYPVADDPLRATSLAGHREVLTFTLGGISKTLGLPQMKLAWMAATGPEAVLAQSLDRLDIILDTYLSVNAPVQQALSSWFLLKSEIQREIQDRIQENRTFLTREVSSVRAVSLLDTEGGWYAVLRLAKNKSEEDWALEFLKQDHVYVHPGYFYDFEEEAYIVISLLPPTEAFQESVRRLLKRIETNV